MESHNRLLALLNSAASPPATQATPPLAHQPSSTAPPTLNPPSGTVREPSPFPPPPSLQSVSLNDLFRNLGAPSPANQPPPRAQSGANEMNPSAMMQGSESHANNLLGMLGRVGGGQTGSGSQSGPMSPPNGAGTPLASNQAINLLSMFKSPPPPEPTNAVSAQPSAPSPVPANDRGVDPSPPPHVSGTTSPRPTDMPESNLGPPPSTAKPSKSPFDFVSPFDVFEKPSPKPTPTAAPKASVPAPSAKKAAPSPKQHKAASPQVAQKEDAFAVPPARINGTVVHPGEPEASAPSPTIESTPKQQIRTSVENTPTTTQSGSVAQSPLHLPWQVSKASRGIQSEGPKPLSSYNKIDYSKLAGRASVNTDGLISVVPVTKMKDCKTTYSSGRIVAMSGDWIAYGMTRGRVRLIDVNTGAKQLLQLPNPVNVIDMATSTDYIAILASDYSITVFHVSGKIAANDTISDYLAHIPLTEGDGKPVGQGISGPVYRVELLEQGSGRLPILVVGGEDGVAFVDLPGPKSLEEIPDKDILMVEGTVLAWAINQNKLVVAVITDTHLSLWRAADRTQVWQGPLDTDYPSLTPSSLRFSDSNLVVGRANDTVLEVIQLGNHHAILSTIELVAPEPTPAIAHYSHAVFDHASSILWVAAHARGSLLGFRYTLKGVPVIKDAAADRGSIVAFDQLVEIPLDPIVSFTIKSGKDGIVVFYATSEGYSKATIDKRVLDAFKPSASADRTPHPLQFPNPIAQHAIPTKAANADKKETKSAPKAKPAAKATPPPPPGPAPAPAAPAPAPAPEAQVDQKPDIREAPAPSQPEPTKAVASTSLDSPNLAALLKQTEDRLSNRIKQNIESALAAAPKGEVFNSAKLAAEVSTKVSTQLKAAVSEALQQEMKKSLIPAASASIQDEVRSVAPKAIQTALNQTMSTVNKNIESSLLSSMPRMVSSAVQPALERMLQDSIKQAIIPALAESSQQMADRISQDLKSEMVQIRKDLQPAAPPVDNGRVLQTLVDAIAALQKKVEQLSTAQQAPAPPVMPVQAPAPSAIGIDLEEIFTQALTVQGPGAIFQLVNDFWGFGGFILPLTPDRKPPFSQIIIVTLLHRLALASTELAPNDPNLVRLISWDRRAAMHLDPNDPMLKGHISRIIPSVVGILETTIHNLMSRFGGDVAAQHVTQAKAIIEILLSKQIPGQ